MGLALMYSFSHAQLIDENFNSGLPDTWTQWTAEEVYWESHDSFGVGGSGCAVSDRAAALFGPTSGWLQTPLIDLTTIADPEITFSIALVQNSNEGPAVPNVSLWFDTGGGWNYITNWGPVDATGVDNVITTTSIAGGPLEADDITWVDISVDLSAYSGFSSIRFSFGGDFPIYAAGWVLVDDVIITGSDVVDGASIFETQNLKGLKVYPNPASDVLYIEKKDQDLDRLEIYNLLGEKVMDISLKDMSTLMQLNLDGIQAGMYTIVFYAAEEKRYTNLVSIH